jgi:hypothetical protein
MHFSGSISHLPLKTSVWRGVRLGRSRNRRIHQATHSSPSTKVTGAVTRLR